MKTPRSPLGKTRSNVVRLISYVSHSRSTELLKSSAMGLILMQSELCDDMSPTRVLKII